MSSIGRYDDEIYCPKKKIEAIKILIEKWEEIAEVGRASPLRAVRTEAVVFFHCASELKEALGREEED